MELQTCEVLTRKAFTDNASAMQANNSLSDNFTVCGAVYCVVIDAFDI